MDNNDEIVGFGHRIPKEVYEDYERLQEVSQDIRNILTHSNQIDENKKIEILALLSTISMHFKEMQHNKLQPPSLKA